MVTTLTLFQLYYRSAVVRGSWRFYSSSVWN